MSRSLFDLTGRRALITGASRGIGLGLARGLAAAGAAVAINGRNAEAVAKAAAELRAGGAEVFEAPFDVTDRAQVEAGVTRIEAELGPIDILVNNAGMQRRAPLEDFAQQDWDDLMALNLDSVFIVGQIVARRMIPRGQGKIINTCSAMTRLARASVAPYTAAKGAVGNLTMAMCADWAKYGLNINGIAPGYFATELTSALVNDPEFSAWLEKRTPQGRWGRIEELVGAAVFLASDAASFVNGHVLYVDGGLTTSV
ncbi:MAG TPA: SDR family oxidoreductase [Thermohalobaculum sp.]|nr:SDR family oxidoreductase [Thermohalobaculum sp.]